MPAPKRPLWLIPVALAVVLVVGVVAWLLTRDGGTDTVALPTLAGLSVDEATAALDDAGLRPGDQLHRHDPDAAPGSVAGGVVDGEPVDEGAALEEGTTVDLDVVVHLTAPTPLAPPPGAILPAGSSPFVLFWEEVDGAAAYRVDVRQCEQFFPQAVEEVAGELFEEARRSVRMAPAPVRDQVLDQLRNTAVAQVPGLDDLVLRQTCSSVTSGEVEPDEPFSFELGVAEGFWRVSAVDDHGTVGPAGQAAFKIE